MFDTYTRSIFVSVIIKYQTKMQDLYLKGGCDFPTIDFRRNGDLTLKGKWFSNTTEIIEPIITFATHIVVENVFLTIQLDLFNASTAKHLFMIFREFEKNNKVKNIFLIWHLDQDDRDTLDFGKMLCDSIEKCKIEYHFYEAELL